MELLGWCDPAFVKVRDAFISNFEDHGEIGASAAVIANGRTVVDLWAGYRDLWNTKPWCVDTIVNFWSATKGINAICFAILVDRGLVSYEDPVSKFWPAFGIAGKSAITLGELLAHQAGLSGFLEPTTVDEMLSGAPAAARLAAQAPIWEPGQTAGYHGMTLGVLSTFLFQCIEGRSIRQFVRDEIARPFALDLSIGVEPDDERRVAQMKALPALDMSSFDPGNVAQFKAFGNPPTPGDLSNDPQWYAADLPSANGFGNARALAQLYELTMRPDAAGRMLVSRGAIEKAAACRFAGVDIVKGVYTRWSAGFWLNPDRYLYGPNAEAYGFSGWGGSFGFADPIADIAAGYTMNKMSDRFDADPRRRGLIDAIYASL